MAISYKNIGINKWQIEKLPKMKSEAVFYAKEEMLPQIERDLSLEQLTEAAMLPGVISPVIGLPDIHQGFGLPIGGVMATTGLISVGAVGMDINCGVRLLVSEISHNPEKFTPQFLRELINKIEREIPIGVGGERKILPPGVDFESACLEGAEAIVKAGFGNQDDLDATEEGGKLLGAKIEAITPKAQKRAKKQLGTLGSGNHFIEIQKVESIFDEKLAREWGLFKNQVCVMIHSGSRALGHQTCTDYTETFWKLKDEYHIEIPRQGLAALPLEAKEARDYFSAMTASVNFAFANRQLMTHFVRQVFAQAFSVEQFQLRTLYDVAHNIAKWEEHQSSRMLIHRKGATRALPAGHSLLPEALKKTGQPAIVPGSMGTASYVLVGTLASAETFFSVNHGAGRVLSRSEAFRKISEEQFNTSMGAVIHNLSFHRIADEAPGAYKDINLVVDTLIEAGLTRKVAKLVPLAVIKGE